MKRVLLTGICMLLALSAQAHEGTGIRNGGSGLYCADDKFYVVEDLISQRFTRRPPIENREDFIHAVLDRVNNRVFQKLLIKWWYGYDDSEFWPEGDIYDFDVYYYDSLYHRIQYGTNGIIPAGNRGDPLCQTPMYAPELCCDRVLISYFGERNPEPTKIAAAYDMLDPFGRNVLELHEAVFRAARDLGSIPAPEKDEVTQEEIRRYLSEKRSTGEIPTTWVEIMVVDLLSDEASVGFEAKLSYLWQWSNAIYGQNATPAKP